MKLPARGREYWHPELGTIPPGAVAVKAEFTNGDYTSGWTSFETVDGDQVVLIAGPDVDQDDYPNPAETVELPAGRTMARVLLVGPGSKEIVIRDAGVVDVQ
jgi:hypothetical protein